MKVVQLGDVAGEETTWDSVAVSPPVARLSMVRAHPPLFLPSFLVIVGGISRAKKQGKRPSN